MAGRHVVVSCGSVRLQNIDTDSCRIWWDIVYRNRPSEVRSSKGKLVDYGRAVGADTRPNARPCSKIYEIEQGNRQLGLHNFVELENYVTNIGKSLP